VPVESTGVTVKSFYSPHCLSKLFGFSKRVEAVRVASFLNPIGIVVLVKDAKIFAITPCGYIPPVLRLVHARRHVSVSLHLASPPIGLVRRITSGARGNVSDGSGKGQTVTELAAFSNS